MQFQIAIAPLDAAILIGYLILVVLFGLWMGRGQRDMTGYLLGGRDLPWWAILGSIVATETSTVTFLSVPGLAFAEKLEGVKYLDPAVGGDMRFLQLAIGILVGRILIVYFLLPLFFRGQLLPPIRYCTSDLVERRRPWHRLCSWSPVTLVTACVYSSQPWCSKRYSGSLCRCALCWSDC
jgi:hypothetical protein